MSRFHFRDTALAGLRVAIRKPVGDDRGYLDRMFCADDLKPAIGERMILQVNRTLTKQAGSVRGMHYQVEPNAEFKIVSCLNGAVFDVAVDVRPDSATYLHWHAEVISRENWTSLCIPEGFAHGFQTLTADAELLYFHTAAHEPNAERGIRATDAELAITWPLEITQLSPRDANFAALPRSGRRAGSPPDEV